jgi:hypothetical protein
MQYLRAALVAAIVARAFLPAGAAAPASIVWFRWWSPAFSWRRWP